MKKFFEIIKLAQDESSQWGRESERESESVTLCDCEHYPKISFGSRLLWMDANKPVLPFVDSFLDWCGLHFPFSKLKFSSKLSGITSSKAQYAAGNALRKIVAPSKWAEGKEREGKKRVDRERGREWKRGGVREGQRCCCSVRNKKCFSCQLVAILFSLSLELTCVFPIPYGELKKRVS